MGQSNNLATSADLLRRGATLLQEACPKCGGVQIKFKGNTYCLNETDLDQLLSPTVPKESSNPAPLRKLLEEKLALASKQLETTSDVSEQTKLLELISKYLETLEKLKS